NAASASNPNPAPELTVKKMMLSAGFMTRATSCAARRTRRFDSGRSLRRSTPDRWTGEARESALEQCLRLVRPVNRLRLPRRQVAVDGRVTELGQQAEAAA